MIHSFRNEFESLCGGNAEQQALVNAKTTESWSYGELWDLLTRFSSHLWDAGLRPGDRLFSLLPDSFEQFLAFLTAIWSGLDFCPVSVSLTPEERQQCLVLYRPAAGLVPDGLDHAVAGQLRQATRNKLLIPIPVDGDIRGRVPRVGGRAPESVDRTGRLLLFTSGTTSRPKAIVLNGDPLWSSALAWVGFHRVLDAGSRFYNFLPMSYLGGLFNLGLIPLACHGSVVLSATSQGASALRFWRELLTTGVNTLWLPPTTLRSLVTMYKGRLEGHHSTSKIRVCFLGMAPVTLEEKEGFEEAFDIPVLENFALSETTFLTSEELGSPARRQPGSVGMPLPWTTVRLTPLKDDPSKSEVQVKTPFLFEGYLDPGSEVFLPLTPDGYFPTGDLAEFDEGVLLLRGRSKEIIKKGGYLVSLLDLEEVAQRHASVAQAVAIGVPHRFYGESCVLCVRLADEASGPVAVLTELTEILRATVSKFKWPERIVAVSSFPTTESGKTQKWMMSEWLDSGVGVIASVRMR